MADDGRHYRDVSIIVNGKCRSAMVEVRFSLADFLRQRLGLTGTHLGCEHGICGACTVIVDGRAVRGCLMLAVQADGAEVQTVEGLAADDGALDPLQQAFMDHHGLQCGFCTPGILMTLTAQLAENPKASEAEIRQLLSGNICRCTGYETIVQAALAAFRRHTDEAVT